MAVNFQHNGTDLSTLLATLGASWPQAQTTGMELNGADLNTKFAEAASGTAYGTTGFKINGTDIGLLFASTGSTTVAVTNIFALSATSSVGNPSGTLTTGTTFTTASKGKLSYTYTWTIATGSGITFTGQGTSSTAISGSVAAGTTNSGTFYCAVSDGTTTTHTNTVAWSLHNTSAAYPGSGTLVAGQGSSRYTSIGYSVIATGGSLSPVAFLGGYINEISDITNNSGNNGLFMQVANLTANPGQSAFTQIVTNGHTFTTASATSYSYNAGTAQWEWIGSFAGYVFNNTYSVSIS